MTSVLSEKHFQDEETAFAWVEARVWPEGPICPHCGNCKSARIAKMQGKTTRIGLYNCRECRKPFTVKMGTVFELSHVPMHLWLQAMFLLVSSKKGISSNQLHRTLGVTLKTAWFMSHRLREAMRTVGVAPVGGGGGVVEIDETYIGRKEGVAKARAGGWHKNAVLTLVARGGSARSFHVDRATKAEIIIPIVQQNIAREAHVMTDELNVYSKLGDDFASRGAVDHSREEYAYHDRVTNLNVSVNAVEVSIRFSSVA